MIHSASELTKLSHFEKRRNHDGGFRHSRPVETRDARLRAKDLARAVRVTDSYISQLLTRRKAPPQSRRTDIYPKMEAFLGLRPGELERLVEIERAEETRRRLERPPEPLFRDFRDLVLRKCVPQKLEEVQVEFEARPFGSLERLVARALLGVVQGVAREELEGENWNRLAALVGGRSHEEMRVVVLDFLDTDVFGVSNESCVAFLDPLVESWTIALDTMCLDITLNGDLVEEANRRFAFVETSPVDDGEIDPALVELIEDPRVERRPTEEELRLLRGLRVPGRRPTMLFYYRALQSLRDPLHFQGDGD